MDPRVDRTKQHVLACAQELLAEAGAESVTFTTVANAARVSRNTLYRHWATREDLLVDVALRHYQAEKTARSTGEPPAGTLEDFLRSMRDNLTSPGTAAMLTNLMARAEHDPVSERVLRQVAELRHQTLATMAGPVSDARFARIVGPIFFQALIARRPVDDAFLAEILAWAQDDEVRT